MSLRLEVGLGQVLTSPHWSWGLTLGDASRRVMLCASHSTSWNPKFRTVSTISSSRFEFFKHAHSSGFLTRATNTHGAAWTNASLQPWFSVPSKVSNFTSPGPSCPSRTHQQSLELRKKVAIEVRRDRINPSPRAGFWRRQVCSAISSSTVSVGGISKSAQEEHVDQLKFFYDDNQVLFVDEEWGVVSEVEGGSPWPDWLEEKLSLTLAAGRVDLSSQVLVVGGSPAFIRQLYLASSPTSLVVTHFSLSVLATIKEMNDNAVCWHGAIEELPDSYGPFNSVFLNSLFAVSYSPAHLLLVVASLCKPGAMIVISHCRGKEHLAECKEKNPQLILHDLPDVASLKTLTSPLPLRLVEFQDEPAFYLGVLEVHETSGLHDTQSASIEMSCASMRTATSVEEFPLRARGHVVQGLGRGSKQLGIPTANIDPLEVPREILALPKGVYFGWAQLLEDGLDRGVYKMVMNIGNRPTFEDGEQVTVEVHILHFYKDDFYGKELSVILLGFIRNEMQFNSVDDLVQQINRDIATCEKFLDEEEMFRVASDLFFSWS